LAFRLAIPHAPRRVKWTQVPSAVRRLGTVAAVGLGLFGAAGWGARRLSARIGAEQGALARSAEVVGTVNRVNLSTGEREGAVAKLDVLYEFDGLHRSATGVLAFADEAQSWPQGTPVTLLVDPRAPDHPNEARYARTHVARWDALPYGLGVGGLLALALFAWELRRTFRSDVEPLRVGALVWLTPDEPLPETRAETVFKASYFRQDEKLLVRARARPGRAPVRNGEKVLAAVVPKKPTWVRVIDEDLARTLGWIER